MQGLKQHFVKLCTFNQSKTFIVKYLIFQRCYYFVDFVTGAVFASIALSEVLFSLVGNLIFSAVYANTISIMSGFVYFVMAGSYAIGTAVLV